MIPYSPKDASEYLPEGPYDMELDDVHEGTSKQGNPMLTVTWNILCPDGRVHSVTDYITFPAATWKLKQVAVALGRGSDFEAGTFDLNEFKGRVVQGVLGIEKSEQYGDKNKVKGYKSSTFDPHAQTAPIGKDSDIPF